VVEGGTFGGVALAQVVVEDGDEVGVPVQQGLEGAARSHGGQLAGVTDNHELAVGTVDGKQQAGEIHIGREAGFVEHQHRPLAQRDLPVIEAPQQRPHRPRGDGGLVAEGAGGLAAGGGAQYLIAGGLQRPCGDVEGGGLARAGHPDDDIDRPARPTDPFHRPALTRTQLATQLGLLRLTGLVDHIVGDDRGPPAGEAFERVRDGVLGGEHRGGGIGLVVGTGDAD
jgi:hypothetical protein